MTRPVTAATSSSVGRRSLTAISRDTPAATPPSQKPRKPSANTCCPGSHSSAVDVRTRTGNVTMGRRCSWRMPSTVADTMMMLEHDECGARVEVLRQRLRPVVDARPRTSRSASRPWRGSPWGYTPCPQADPSGLSPSASGTAPWDRNDQNMEKCVALSTPGSICSSASRGLPLDAQGATAAAPASGCGQHHRDLAPGGDRPQRSAAQRDGNRDGGRESHDGPGVVDAHRPVHPPRHVGDPEEQRRVDRHPPGEPRVAGREQQEPDEQADADQAAEHPGVDQCVGREAGGRCRGQGDGQIRTDASGFYRPERAVTTRRSVRDDLDSHSPRLGVTQRVVPDFADPTFEPRSAPGTSARSLTVPALRRCRRPGRRRPRTPRRSPRRRCRGSPRGSSPRAGARSRRGSTPGW